MITVSIVSHGHGKMVKNLIGKIQRRPNVSRIILTKNIPEDLLLPENAVIRIIDNRYPQGFAANHNAAFSIANTQYFCVLNPDIDFDVDPFPELLQAAQGMPFHTTQIE